MAALSAFTSFISLRHFLIALGLGIFLSIAVAAGAFFLSSSQTESSGSSKTALVQIIAASDSSREMPQQQQKQKQEQQKEEPLPDEKVEQEEIQDPAPSQQTETEQSAAEAFEERKRDNIGLLEDTPFGLLPRIHPRTREKPFDAYKKATALDVTGQPKIALAIAGIGLSKTQSENTINGISNEISLVFSPYGRNLDALSAMAVQKNFEYWLSLPMETRAFPANDPGSKALLLNASLEQNRERFFKALGSLKGYAGLVSPENHVFQNAEIETIPVFSEIHRRGLGFLNANTLSSRNFMEMYALRNAAPYLQNDLWIDGSSTEMQIRNQLLQLEKAALSRGQSVGIITIPTPLALSVLQEWIQSLEERDIQLVPLSILAQ